MQRIFRHDLTDPSKFVVTLELVPGARHVGRKLETVLSIAKGAFEDGRVSAVSITDNPGGSPALGPSALAYEIFRKGLDVIVHFTCRDMNRGGMESRALQMALVGMKNVLALNGDYIGKGFGGQCMPVFDLDSVGLILMLGMLNERNREMDPDVRSTPGTGPAAAVWTACARCGPSSHACGSGHTTGGHPSIAPTICSTNAFLPACGN